MYSGCREVYKRALTLPRALPDNQRAFSVIEVLFVALILGILFTGLFWALNIGDYAAGASSAKTEAQAQARRAISWIVNDIRYSTTGEIANNNPSTSHIKFRQVEGVDTDTGYYVLSTDYIEYSFDSTVNKIIRNLIGPTGTILQSWEIGDISQCSFYTRDATALLVPLSQSDLLASNRIVITISAQGRIKSSLTTLSTLTEEVKIRNE